MVKKKSITCRYLTCFRLSYILIVSNVQLLVWDVIMGLRVEPLYQRLGGLVCFSRLRSRFMGLIFFIVGSYEENLFYEDFIYIFLHRSIFVERACGGMLGVRAYETNYF